MSRLRILSVVVCGCVVIAALIFGLVGRHIFFPVMVGVAALLAMFVNLAGEDRREAWRDWLPPRRTYLVPLLLGVAGLSVAIAVPGDANPVIGLGITVFALSGGLAVGIWFKRAMNNTVGKASADDG